MADTNDLRRLGPPTLRAAWLFQAILAGPAFVFFGAHALATAYNPYSSDDLYLSLKDLGLAMFTALIVFILVVQRGYANPAPRVAARLELAKSVLASATWLWVFLDAVFYTPEWDYWRDPPAGSRTRKIVFTLVSSVVLFVRLARKARDDAQEAEAGETDEDMPLLRN
ncbi:hypothetical protein M406DRAFT_334859 [Cryphonectria parasitica EP155]|uniref:Uncharacterized protein n=1 Tax=Cryphonectria parasitica (strain ATCC 38755 / EP155) TaxID=660469 RepID=A0A9P4XSK9_CRYP1|nr:uncharacterized protein M406DRAFT_334859 [Cryphonectria parasitica EP155]KAF3760183.1 hypothetical protein M406DRAFT_334859 [Cryphonectria parasitica EP155]